MLVRTALSLINRRSGSLENPGNPLNAMSLANALAGGQGTVSGISVSVDSAMALPIVYTCVSLLSRTVASLPLILYRRLERGKERATDHALYRVLRDLPNPEMTAYDLHAALMSHLALWGNAYCEIVRNAGGDVVELWPISPQRVTWKRLAPGKLLYEIDMDGTRIGLRGDQVMHLRTLSADGKKGYSFITQAREEISLGIAAREYGSRFFGQDGRPGGVLTHPGSLSQDALDRLRSSWEAAHTGLTNSHRVAILEEAMTFTPTTLPPEDMMFLQTRDFTRKEIAGWFHIPPHMVGDTERSTSWGTGIESQAQGFLTFTLVPWLTSWQQEINRSLLTPTERETYFAEYMTNALLKVDTQARYEAYAKGRNWGWLSVNDVREIENLNPIEGGDVYLSPLNMGNSEVMRDWPNAQQGTQGGAPGAPMPSNQPSVPQPGETLPQSLRMDAGEGDGVSGRALAGIESRAIDVPAWMQDNAQQGLAWHADGLSGDGVTAQTVSEARSLASGNATADKVRRMGAWFARHMGDLDAPSADRGHPDYPSPGVVAHALWGGGSRSESQRAERWANARINALDGSTTTEGRALPASHEGDALAILGMAYDALDVPGIAQAIRASLGDER